ncbi:hypothetical protein ID866_9116 [Astraeus odoratus]|nr:hypothetical protein ID866_9116 [Astraeus odoratus]
MSSTLVLHWFPMQNSEGFTRFTPSQAIDMSKEKDWPLNLGMLDWDSTNILFTKRSLVEFLKYAGVTVDPGFTNIQKLPRYARFGKLSEDPPESANAAATTALKSTATATTTTGRLFEDEFTDDALSTAPPRPSAALQSASKGTDFELGTPDHNESSALPNFIPSRRVRANPGGKSSIASIFGDEETQGQFVPTRKVRERPGGKDNIEGLF